LGLQSNVSCSYYGHDEQVKVCDEAKLDAAKYLRQLFPEPSLRQAHDLPTTLAHDMRQYHRPRPRHDLGQFCGCRQVQGPHPSGIKRAGTIFPQRKRTFVDGRCRFLRFPFQHRFYSTRKIRSRCLPQFSLSRLRRFALHSR
jgi:hypothetical protein